MRQARVMADFGLGSSVTLQLLVYKGTIPKRIQATDLKIRGWQVRVALKQKG
jgi:hypothetical protein